MIKFQIFRLNFSRDISKMHYYSNKFSKSSSVGEFPTQPFLTFDFSDLKLRDLGKLCFFKLIMTKSNLKNSVMTSFKQRHHNHVTEKRHQTKVTRFFNFGALPIKISGYANVRK